MSQLDPGLRPNSAIFIGKDPISSPDPLDVSHPLSDNDFSVYPGTPPALDKRLGQLPSPPHTNSTSGSTGDKDSANAGSVRGSRVPLPVVAVHDEDEGAAMEGQGHHQNGYKDDYDDYDETRLQNLTRADGSPDKRPSRLVPKLDRSTSAVDRNREKLNERLDRYANLSVRSPSSSSVSGLSRSPQPKQRTISLGRSSGAAAAAAAAAGAGLTGSMRHASLTLPRDIERDIFDSDLQISASKMKAEPLRRQALSNSDSSIATSDQNSNHHSHSHSSSSTTSPRSYSNLEDDRSKTPPATPLKRTIEISPGRVIEVSPRQRLVSEPTSPRRMSLLRNEVNVSGGSRRGATGKLVTVDEAEARRENGNGNSAKKSRGGIPIEFMTDQRSFPSEEEDPMDALTLTLPRRPPSQSDRQPSPGLYTSEGSPSLDHSSSTLASPFSATNSNSVQGSQSDNYGSSRLSGLGSISRRPRPAGLRNSYDRWGEPYDQWEKNQLDSTTHGDETDASSVAQRRILTDGDTPSRRPTMRSVVNEGLRAAGLTRASTVGSVRRVLDGEGRSRTTSDARLGDELVSSPTTLNARDRNRDTVDLSRSGGNTRLSVRDRSSSRMSTDEREKDGAYSEMDKLRERVRSSMLSPNVRPPITIHNLLTDRHTGESPALSHRELPDTRRDTMDANSRRDAMDIRRDTITPMDGRETPFNLRAFQSSYRGSALQSQGSLRAYVSPSGTQRTLPPRPNTSASADMRDNISHAHHSSNASTGNLNLIMSGSSSGAGSGPASAVGGGSGRSDPIQLLTDALYMFESHVSRLPHSNTMPETYNEVLRDAKGIVDAAAKLNGALRAAQGVSIEEMVEAETTSPSRSSPSKHHADSTQDVAEVWRKVSAEFREDVRVADELVRALTSFMIGAGRMLRSASLTSANASSGHSRMMSVGDSSSTVGSVSRAGGSVSRADSRVGGSISRGVSVSRGGSSDGRRSVEGWSRNVGGLTDRRSIEGRGSIESPRINDRTADDHRTEALNRLMGGRGADAASQGSGGAGSNGSGNRGSRVSFQRESSRPGTSLSMIRDSGREDLGSPLKTLTSLSSRRSAGRQTPATSNKALPLIPLPLPVPMGGELSFPQTEDGGDRTPIELPRPHVRHSTMPALAVAPPLPTLPSERLLQSTVKSNSGRHNASNSITSASTTSTTRPQASPLLGTVRGSMVVPGAASVGSPTTAMTPTTARPRDMTLSESPERSRTGHSAAVNGLQQVALANPPRKRTISNTDDIYEAPSESTGSGSDRRGLPVAKSNSTMTTSSSNSATASRSSSGSPVVSTLAMSPGERRNGVRPMLNRRTSSTLSGASPNTGHNATLSGDAGRETPTGRQRLVTRMSSAGALFPASSPSPVSLSRTSSSFMASGEGRSTDSGTEEERRLRRTNNRLSLNAVLNKRPHVSDLLRRRHEDDGRGEGGESSPSSSAKERRERRLAGQS